MNLLNTLPCAVGYKNTDSVYIACNKLLAKYMGYTDQHTILGLTDFDIKNEMAELAPQFIKQDKIVLQSNHEHQHLDIGCYDDGRIQLHLSIKKPLFDDNANVIGTVFTCIELKPFFLKKIYESLLLDKGPCFFTIGGQYTQYQLSDRESECLFFLIRGLTAKEIAKKFKLSTKTIEYHICQLKNKLACQSRSELIEKAIYLGFMFNIPLNFSH